MRKPFQSFFTNAWRRETLASLSTSSQSLERPIAHSVSVPPSGTVQVQAGVEVPRTIRPGHRTLTVTVDWSGTSWTQESSLAASTVAPKYDIDVESRPPEGDRHAVGLRGDLIRREIRERGPQPLREVVQELGYLGWRLRAADVASDVDIVQRPERRPLRETPGDQHLL